MNIPFPPSAPSSYSRTRPSHTSRLKQRLLSCLDIVPQALDSVDDRLPPRKIVAQHPPRWVELNESLDQLGKSIAGLKKGDWKKLGVVVPILAQLSLLLADLLRPGASSPRYTLLRSKEYTRSLPREQAKALLALLKTSLEWSLGAVEETSSLTPSLLAPHPLDASLHHLLLDPLPSSATASSSSPARVIHLPVSIGDPLRWILLPPRALEKRLAEYTRWTSPTLPSSSTPASSLSATTLLTSVTHLSLAFPPLRAPTAHPFRRPHRPNSTRSKNQFRRASSASSSSSSSSASSDDESFLSDSSRFTTSASSRAGPTLSTYTLHLLTALLPSLSNLVSIHLPMPLDAYPLVILSLTSLRSLTFASSASAVRGTGVILRTTAPKKGGTHGVPSLVYLCVTRVLEMTEGCVRVGDLIGWGASVAEEDEGERQEGWLKGQSHLSELFWAG